MTTIDEMIAARGYKPISEHRPGVRSFHARVRADVPMCLTNDKLFFELQLWDTAAASGHVFRTANVELRAEYAVDRWCILQVYSIKQDDLPSVIEQVEADLLRAWSAMQSTT